MSNVVDERVVEMRFDNKQFESGVQTSMGTLQRLKDALNFNKSAQSLNQLTTAVNTNFSGMSGALQAIQDRFSTMGIIGMTALQELASMAVNVGVSLVNHILRPLNQVQDLIVNGGKQRALNIEQAKYMIQGLGYAFKDLDDDINAAVNGTRYGYDEAAMAASQLAASGIEFTNINGRTLRTTGEQLSDMGVSLTAISGVASMANTEYGRIADIFTRVAGNGKLMTMQLQQLSGYGLNIAAAMAKQWGKTEAEVRQMVSEGKVDFQMFADAMYDSFADAALKADTTLTGVSANIRAAWKKIGMDFWTPIVENNSAYVVALGKFKNLVNNFIRPVTKAAAQGGWTDFINTLAKELDAILSYEPLLHAVQDSVSAIINGIAKFKINDKLKDAFDYIGGIADYYRLFLGYDRLGKEGFNVGFSGDDLAKGEKFHEILRKLGTILEGVNSGIHIFVSFISALGKGFVTLLSHLFPAADGFLTLGESISENVTAFDEWLTSNDVFNKAVQYIDEKVGPILDIIADKIRNFAEELARHGPKFEDFKRVFGQLFEGVSKFFEGIKNVFSQIIPLVKQGLEWLGDALGKAAGAIGDFLSNLNFNDIGNLAAAGGGLAILAKIVEKLWLFIRSIGSGGNFFVKAIEAFNLFQDTLMQYQMNLKSDILLQIGQAVAFLAGSLFVISLIETDKLWDSVAAIGALMAEFSAFLAVFAKIGGNPSGGPTKLVDRLLQPLMSISRAWNKIGQGAQLVAVAGAILVLAFAVKKLGELSTADAIQGLIAVEVLLKELEVFLKKVNLENLSANQGTGLLLIAASLLIISNAVKSLGTIPIIELVKGLAAVEILLLEISSFTKKLSVINKDYIGAGIGMIAIATAMLIMSKAIQSMGSLDANQMGQGLVGIGLALAGLVIALNQIKPIYLTEKAFAITILAGAMIVMAKAVETMGSLPVEQMGQGLAGIGVSLLAIVLALNMLDTGFDESSVIIKANAILVLSAAMNVMAWAIKSLGSMDLWSIVKALIAFGGVVGIIVWAGPALTFAAEGMLALGGAMLMFGAGIALVGGGVFLLGAGLVSLSAGIVALGGALATAGVEIVAGVTAIISGIILAIATSATVLAEGLVTFLVAIGNGASRLIQVVVQLGTAIIQGVVELLPQIVDLVLLIISEILRVIIEAAPQIVLTAAQLMVAFIEGITEKIPEIVEAAFVLIITFIDSMSAAINEHGSELIDSFSNLIGTVIHFLAEAAFQFLWAAVEWIAQLVMGVVDGISDVVTGFSDLCVEAVNCVADFVSDFVEAGANLVAGIIEGIGTKAKELWDSVTSMASEAWHRLTSVWQEKSPSRLFAKAGENLDLGIVMGINHYAKRVYDSVTDLGETVYDSFKETIGSIGDVIEGDVDLNPTITPVMDLSAVQSGAATLNSMFGTTDLSSSLTVGAKLDNISAIASLNSKWNTFSNGDVVNSIDKLHNDISDLNNRIEEMNEKDATYEFNLNTQLDGRNIARSTARYNRQELALLDRNTNRKGGKVR